jgi:hypothetical protein
MLENPLKDPVEKKNWVGVIVMGAFMIVMAVWGLFKDQLIFGRGTDKEHNQEITNLHKYYQGKIDTLNLRNEATIVQANRKVDRANARTDSVIKVQIQEKSDLIALFTSKFDPVQALVEANRRKTRTLDKKVESASNIVKDMKVDADAKIKENQ